MRFHRVLIDHIVQTLHKVFFEQQYADKVIERTFKANPKWGARDRRYFAETTYDIVRWRRKLAYAVAVDDSHENCWPLWAAYTALQGHTLPDWPEVAGVSAQALQARLASCDNPAILHSLPDWLYQLCQQQLGEVWPNTAAALNQQAEVFLRTNTLKITRDKLRAGLLLEDIDAEPLPAPLADGLVLSQRKNVFTSNAFKAGFFEVQDASSQQIAPLLDVKPGMRVVDACAGAGGKSLHLAAMMQNKGYVLSMDVHQWKLDELRKRAKRNGVDIIETRLIEGSKTIKRLAQKFDRVLLDVPCSGLGVLRRNPDAKWKITAAEIANIQQLQADILRQYSQMCKVGGQLVYATCSILPSENEQQVQAFLAANSQWSLQQQLTLLPGRDPYDGFYAAVLVRNS